METIVATDTICLRLRRLPETLNTLEEDPAPEEETVVAKDAEEVQRRSKDAVRTETLNRVREKTSPATKRNPGSKSPRPRPRHAKAHAREMGAMSATIDRRGPTVDTEEGDIAIITKNVISKDNTEITDGMTKVGSKRIRMVNKTTEKQTGDANQMKGKITTNRVTTRLQIVMTREEICRKKLKRRNIRPIIKAPSRGEEEGMEANAAINEEVVMAEVAAAEAVAEHHRSIISA